MPILRPLQQNPALTPAFHRPSTSARAIGPSLGTDQASPAGIVPVKASGITHGSHRKVGKHEWDTHSAERRVLAGIADAGYAGESELQEILASRQELIPGVSAAPRPVASSSPRLVLPTSLRTSPGGFRRRSLSPGRWLPNSTLTCSGVAGTNSLRQVNGSCVRAAAVLKNLWSSGRGFEPHRVHAGSFHRLLVRGVQTKGR